MKRRTFLMATGSVGGALLTGGAWASSGQRRAVSAPVLSPQDKDVASALRLNAWLRLAPDGTVWLAMARSEMGQGIHAALRMMVAEELGCRLEQIRLEDPDVEGAYANQTALAEMVPFLPEDRGLVAQSARSVMRSMARLLDFQITGGSTSTADAWSSLRGIAAATRQRLEQCAADAWQVDPATVSLVDGVIQGPAGQRCMPQDCLPAVLQVKAPATIRYRDASAYRLIGSNPPRSDLRNKVDGTAVFGADVRLPGMLTAVPRFCPTLGGTAVSIRNLDALKKRPGVLDVVILPKLACSGGIAVIATGYWSAWQASLAADVQWEDGAQSQTDSDEILRTLTRQLDAGSVHWTYHRRGDSRWFAPTAEAQAPQTGTLVQTYTAPYLAHVTMEPMNATAWLRDGQLDVWAPTQTQGPGRERAAKIAGLSKSAVRIHTTYLGGGFGRRAETDFIACAVFAAQYTQGRPVQMLWPREQDTTHDFYRPCAAAQLAARVDGQGLITHWHHRTASGSVGHQAYNRAGLPGVGPDKTTVEGGFDTAYGAKNLRVDHVLRDDGVPLGYWRSVGHSYQAFFIESFIDELAHSARLDPFEFRLNNLPPQSRQALTLRAACERAGYGRSLPAGQAFGLAVHESFGSVAAMVVKLRRDGDRLRVDRVSCAVDCGLVIHPDGVRQQIEGSVVFGLSAALSGRIDIRQGQVQQQNLDSLPLLTLTDSPVVDVVLMPSANPPSGVGEIGVPPLAPALANAVFALTGQRLRHLPLGDLKTLAASGKNR